MASDESEKSRADILATLASLNGALASEIGRDRTEQVGEYMDHHEFGLALELIIALVLHHGLDARAYEAGVERLVKAMGMEDSHHVSEWWEYLGAA
jgi:hypothetical protein